MKKILLILGVLILAFFAYYFTRPDSFLVERSIVIDATTEQIWPQVSKFENWSTWSPWMEKDSTIKNKYEGTQGTVGSKSMYTSEESGSGEMIATSIQENEEITYNMRFIEPWESESKGFVRLKKLENGTEVSWGFSGESKGFARLMNMDKMIGGDFDRGMELLKEKVENMPKKEVKEYKIEKGVFTPTKYIGMKFTDLPMEKVTGELFAETYGKLSKVDFEDGDKMPSVIYYKWDLAKNTTDMTILLSVKEAPKNLPEGIELIEIPEKESFYIDYYGMYNDMESAHTTLNKYLIDNNLGENYAAIEEYVTDPGSEPNPKKWLTKISYISF